MKHTWQEMYEEAKKQDTIRHSVERLIDMAKDNYPDDRDAEDYVVIALETFDLMFFDWDLSTFEYDELIYYAKG